MCSTLLNLGRFIAGIHIFNSCIYQYLVNEILHIFTNSWSLNCSEIEVWVKIANMCSDQHNINSHSAHLCC